MSEYVLDTVILVDALMGVEQAKRELLARSRHWISRVTWIEILSGTTPDGEAATARSHYSNEETAGTTAHAHDAEKTAVIRACAGAEPDPRLFVLRRL